MIDFQDRFARCVSLFSEARDKLGSRLSLFGFAADSSGELANHIFQENDRYADLRSVSKVVVGLVLGVLLSRKTELGDVRLGLGERVLPLLRHHMNGTARHHWRDVRIVDLLNHTIGHDEGFLFRKDLGDLPESDYLAYLFDAPIRHSPGTHFSYSNVGPFLFSVIVQDWLGKSLHDVAQAAILEPLGIESRWRCFGEYSAGSTGLSMRNGDLIKLASLLRDGGVFRGRAIVAKSWVDEMISPRSLTPHMFDSAQMFPRYAYGIGLWICENGSYYCDGTNGQYLIVVPDRKVALSTMGEQPDMEPITRCMTPLTAEPKFGK